MLQCRNQPFSEERADYDSPHSIKSQPANYHRPRELRRIPPQLKRPADSPEYQDLVALEHTVVTLHHWLDGRDIPDEEVFRRVNVADPIDQLKYRDDPGWPKIVLGAVQNMVQEITRQLFNSQQRYWKRLCNAHWRLAACLKLLITGMPLSRTQVISIALYPSIQEIYTHMTWVGAQLGHVAGTTQLKLKRRLDIFLEFVFFPPQLIRPKALKAGTSFETWVGGLHYHHPEAMYTFECQQEILRRFLSEGSLEDQPWDREYDGYALGPLSMDQNTLRVLGYGDTVRSAACIPAPFPTMPSLVEPIPPPNATRNSCTLCGTTTHNQNECAHYAAWVAVKACRKLIDIHDVNVYRKDDILALNCYPRPWASELTAPHVVPSDKEFVERDPRRMQVLEDNSDLAVVIFAGIDRESRPVEFLTITMKPFEDVMPPPGVGAKSGQKASWKYLDQAPGLPRGYYLADHKTNMPVALEETRLFVRDGRQEHQLDVDRRIGRAYRDFGVRDPDPRNHPDFRRDDDWTRVGAFEIFGIEGEKLGRLMAAHSQAANDCRGSFVKHVKKYQVGEQAGAWKDVASKVAMREVALENF